MASTTTHYKIYKMNNGFYVNMKKLADYALILTALAATAWFFMLLLGFDSAINVLERIIAG